jgi:hypothetical protein
MPTPILGGLSSAPTPDDGSQVMLDLLPGLPDPLLYGLTILCFGGWMGLAYMVRLLFVGKLCTGRELSEKNARISTLEAMVQTRDEQVALSVRVLPEVADVLRKFHVAAELVRQEDDP